MIACDLCGAKIESAAVTNYVSLRLPKAPHDGSGFVPDVYFYPPNFPEGDYHSHCFGIALGDRGWSWSNPEPE